MVSPRLPADSRARRVQTLAIVGLVLLGMGVVGSRAEEVEDTEPVIRLSWQSESNRVYRVQRSTTLEEDDWHDVGDPLVGNGKEMFVYVPGHLGDRKVYRIEVEP